VNTFPGLEEVDVVGPVRGEIFVVWLDADAISITGPDGPRGWIIQIDDAEHPVEAVDRIVRGLLGPPLLVHSTSWRRDGTAIVLSFVVVIGPRQAAGLESLPVTRADLARSDATRAPAAIRSDQVLEHGLRHLAWLAREDPVVSERLSQGWKNALSRYVPEPFRGFA
jgi:hypothetical protein